MSNTFTIDDISISRSNEPFIIAEMSGNHNQSLDKALQIVEKAAESGVHAIKLQTYTADTITLNVKKNEFFIDDKDSLWKGNSLYDLYKIAHTPWEWHEEIIKKAKELNIICFSTPFDETSVDFLEELNVPAYKIASPEIIHLPLIKKVAETGKPIFMSTGMASISEISEAVDTARSSGCQNIILFKCTSSYPASPKNSNIITLPHMRKLFNCEVGLSDHTLGIGAPIAAVAQGAVAIEKHLTLDRDEGGVDSAFSLEPKEFKSLVVESKRAWLSLGKINYGPTKSEEKTLNFRRSIYVAEDLLKGAMFNINNLRIVRPGLGIHPKYYNIILGRKINRDVKKGTPFKWDLID